MPDYVCLYVVWHPTKREKTTEGYKFLCITMCIVLLNAKTTEGYIFVCITICIALLNEKSFSFILIFSLKKIDIRNQLVYFIIC